jgi:hypothetical protein
VVGEVESVVELPSDVEVEPSVLDEADLDRERCGASLLAVLLSEDDAGGGP